MSELQEFIRNYPSIVMDGIRMVVGVPRRFDLRVDHDWDARHKAAGGGHRLPIGRDSSHFPVRKSQPQPPLKTIHLMLRDERGGRSHLRISINLETRRIDESYTSMSLFGRVYLGSAGIGVALFSAPVVLPLLPVLLVTGGVYLALEKKRGMSRHGWTLLDALKGQLDAEIEALLTEALRNTWKDDQERARIEMEEVIATMDAKP